MRPGPDPSALYLPVAAAEPLLDAVRGLPHVGLLEPAHVSLGYPWVPAEEALARRDDVRAAAAATPPLEVVLHGPHRFDVDVRGRLVVHLLPDDPAPFAALAARLRADLRTPHLSVARVLRDGDVDAVEAAVAPLLPLRATLDVLELTVRRGRDWEVALTAPLGVPPAPTATPAAPPR